MVDRYLVKGTSGAGKTTLARELALRLGVPHVELDGFYHGPNWTPAPADEFSARVQAALDDAHGWVVDGNYDSKLGGTLLERATVVIWLDLPLTTKLARLVGRTTRRCVRNEELWNGNRESLLHVTWGYDALLPWAVRSHFAQRRKLPELLAGRSSCIRLRSAAEVKSWLATVPLRARRA